MSKDSYEYSIQLVPKGVSPHQAQNVKTVTFTGNTLDRDDIVSELHTGHSGIDSYAMRNHWDIFQIEAEYNNKPWNGFSELCADLVSFDEANDWKCIEECLYIRVDDGKESEYISNVESYYKPLSPIIENGSIIRVNVTPNIK